MNRHDVIIIGGGPAGLAAATRLGELGHRDVVVLERESETGGVPRHCGHTGFGLSEFRRLLHGPDYARRLTGAVGEAELRTSTTATRLLPGGEVEVATPSGPRRLSARAVLIALGARETPRSARLVSGTRPWGVLTTGALQQLVYLARAKPFERAVIVGTELVSFSAILTLRHAGITPVGMIEEHSRITARRPGDWIARTMFGVPVWTETRLVAIHGRRRVEAVEIERAGRRERIACDGVVFTGRFVPEAALLADSHLEVDAATGGPSIDQHWRCSDPAFFAAGNLLRPIETAATAWREGRAAAEAIAAALAGRLPTPERELRIGWSAPIRYVYPQRLSLPGWPVHPLLLRVRLARAARGRISLVADGREIWSRRIAGMPERRLSLPGDRLALDDLRTLAIGFTEAGAAATPDHSAIKPQTNLTERS
jgi:NADPH-dependent 2,4-dienoyl-CoA reductase/sulfur reductase-like enzyme